MVPGLNMIKRFNRAGRSFDIQLGKIQLIAHSPALCLLTPYMKLRKIAMQVSGSILVTTRLTAEIAEVAEIRKNCI